MSFSKPKSVPQPQPTIITPPPVPEPMGNKALETKKRRKKGASGRSSLSIPMGTSATKGNLGIPV